MKALHRLTFIVLPLIALFGTYAFQLKMPAAQQGAASPTPTYDPFVEPPLPPNPTEFELGRNLYWHWCMPCHGDRGQGLTDQFRGLWEPEHQNCWERGCHAGRQEDTGFPIPTIVPALVSADHLSQFSSLQSLADFLKATHPPQSPGILKGEEYHAIALFVFTMNNRSPTQPLPTPPPASTPTVSPVPFQEQSPISNQPSLIAASLIVLTAIILVTIIRRKSTHDSQG